MKLKSEKTFYVDPVETGKKLKEISENRGLSVRTLQEKLGLSCPQPIYRWYNGVTLPSVDSLCLLSKLLEVSLDEILVVREGEKMPTYLVGENLLSFLSDEDMRGCIMKDTENHEKIK